MDTTGRRGFWLAALIAAIVLQALVAAGLYTTVPHSHATEGATSHDAVAVEEGRQGDLPAPSSVAVGEFEEKLFAFLNARKYVDLGWK